MTYTTQEKQLLLRGLNRLLADMPGDRTARQDIAALRQKVIHSPFIDPPTARGYWRAPEDEQEVIAETITPDPAVELYRHAPRKVVVVDGQVRLIGPAEERDVNAPTPASAAPERRFTYADLLGLDHG